VNWRICILTICLVPLSAWSDAATLQPPPPLPAKFPIETFGDERNVELLAELLDDRDAMVREQGVRALGETHNALGLPHIRKALKDTNINVRCAALRAVARFPEKQCAPILIGALDDVEDRLVLTALELLRDKKISSTGERIASLLPRYHPAVQVEGLLTLNELQRPADPKVLKVLLGSSLASVRLRAIENSMFLTDPAGLSGELVRLGRSDASGAVRAAAIEAAGKFALPALKEMVSQSTTSRDPFIRRGVVRALVHARETMSIRAFLDDESPMVRLAAIRGAGNLKCTNCVERLFELLENIPEPDAHLAARNALAQIATPEVVPKAAEIVQKLSGNPTDERSARNLRAACWLLGEMRSNIVVETQLRLLVSLQVDSPILVELAESLGKIGDRRAISPLRQVLLKCRTNGLGYLRTLQATSKPPPPPPYDDDVTCTIIRALGDMKAIEAVGTIVSVARAQLKRGRLNSPAAAAMQVLPQLITDTNREAIESCICDVLGDGRYDWLLDSSRLMSSARIEAARSAAKLEIEEAVPSLQRILQRDRPSRAVIHAAAWSIQEITGETLDVPNPKVVQGSDWIVRRMEE